jgi:hypothetical protein
MNHQLLGTAIALSMISPALATRPQPVINAYHDAIGNKPYNDTDDVSAMAGTMFLQLEKQTTQPIALPASARLISLAAFATALSGRDVQSAT